jgi:glycosyltransferase involved in cell wall biosynthesis
MKVLILSPVGNVPVTAGNSSRVNDLVGVLQDLDCEINFCFVPIRIFSTTNDSTLELRRYWGDSLTLLNNGIVYKGRLYQRCLKLVQRVVRGVSRKYLNVTLDWMWLDFIFDDVYISKSMQIQVQELVRLYRPDLIICEYAVISGLLVDIRQDVLKILDAHDRFTDRNKKLRSEGTFNTWISFTHKQEQSYLARFDHVWAIQKKEQQAFEPGLNANTIVETIDILVGAKPVEEEYIQPGAVGYLGSNNPHNKRAILLFLELHWMKIRESVENAVFYIAGAKYPELDAWHNQGVVSLGRVEDLSDFYRRCAIIVNPCPSGTGLKIKSIEALQYGKPLVSTAIGAEGIEDAEGVGLVLADINSPDFSDRCIELLKDVERCNNLSGLAVDFINVRARQNLERIKQIIS